MFIKFPGSASRALQGWYTRWIIFLGMLNWTSESPNVEFLGGRTRIAKWRVVWKGEIGAHWRPARQFPSCSPEQLWSWVCVLLFFRSTSLSWKSSPTLQMQLPMLLQLWWSFWLPGAECQKTEVGKQLKSSWERYQTPWQDENLNFGIQCYSYAWQHKVFRSKEIIFLFTEYNGLYVL